MSVVPQTMSAPMQTQLPQTPPQQQPVLYPQQPPPAATGPSTAIYQLPAGYVPVLLQSGQSAGHVPGAPIPTTIAVPQMLPPTAIVPPSRSNVIPPDQFVPSQMIPAEVVPGGVLHQAAMPPVVQAVPEQMLERRNSANQHEGTEDEGVSNATQTEMLEEARDTIVSKPDIPVESREDKSIVSGLAVLVSDASSLPQGMHHLTISNASSCLCSSKTPSQTPSSACLVQLDLKLCPCHASLPRRGSLPYQSSTTPLLTTKPITTWAPRRGSVDCFAHRQLLQHIDSQGLQVRICFFLKKTKHWIVYWWKSVAFENLLLGCLIELWVPILQILNDGLARMVDSTKNILFFNPNIALITNILLCLVYLVIT